jgi:hypothetical protein
MRVLFRVVVPAALVVMTTGISASAQPPSAQAATPPATPAAAPAAPAAKPYVPIFPETTQYPVDVERVKERVEQLPAVKFDEQQTRFYVLIVAKEPDFIEKWAKDYDFRNGPTRRGAAMTHNEFLNMVTPKELNELFGATSASSFAMFQAALTNAAGQALIKKGIEAIRNARNEREIQAIRQQIDRELAALLGK